MGLEILAFAAAGCILGTITGLVPGLHVNTIALLALEAPTHPGLIALIASMSITHTFVDFIPSILLGVPSEETFLGILPGHKLLLEGKGETAIRLTIAGGLFAGIISIMAMPVFITFLEKNREMLILATAPILLGIIVLMVLDEQNKATAALVIMLSGCLGLLALRSQLGVKEPLFCLATGFFGASALIDSMVKKATIPKQAKTRLVIGKGKAAKASAMAVLGGLIVSTMPSIGASQAAFILGKLFGKMKSKEYLILLGGTNTSTMMLSFTVLFAISKARTGSAAALNMLGEFGAGELFTACAAGLLGLGFGAIVTELISTKAMNTIRKTNYRKLNAAVLAAITAMVFMASGAIGLLFYLTAAAIGLSAINAGIRRTNTMAFLMVPTIAHYTGLF